MGVSEHQHTELAEDFPFYVLLAMLILPFVDPVGGA